MTAVSSSGPRLVLDHLGPSFLPHPAQVLQERLIDFAVQASELTAHFPRTARGLHLSRQLLRCATSAAPNYGEAQSAESRPDFVHKMRICLKELREAQVWLRLVQRLELCDSSRVDRLLDECSQLVAIFTASVITADRRRMDGKKKGAP